MPLHLVANNQRKLTRPPRAKKKGVRARASSGRTAVVDSDEFPWIEWVE